MAGSFIVSYFRNYFASGKATTLPFTCIERALECYDNLLRCSDVTKIQLSVRMEKSGGRFRQVLVHTCIPPMEGPRPVRRFGAEIFECGLTACRNMPFHQQTKLMVE